jgi:HD-GYP domain-containing protein (c-di-GMP phosphodiesterase class II)
VEQVTDYMREVAGHHPDPKNVDLLIQNMDKAVEINRQWPD